MSTRSVRCRRFRTPEISRTSVLSYVSSVYTSDLFSCETISGEYTKPDRFSSPFFSEDLSSMQPLGHLSFLIHPAVLRRIFRFSTLLLCFPLYQEQDQSNTGRTSVHTILHYSWILQLIDRTFSCLQLVFENIPFLQMPPMARQQPVFRCVMSQTDTETYRWKTRLRK